MSCDPTTTVSAEDMTGLKENITTIDVVVESNDDTTTTPDGKTIFTLQGILNNLGAPLALDDLSDVTTTVGSDKDVPVFNIVTGLYENRALSADDVQSGTFADARISESSVRQHTLLTTNLTVQIPTDYPTLQAAVDDLSQRTAQQGVTITLNIESGHQPTTGLEVTNGDYGHFRITSDDAEVTVDNSFTGNLFYAEFAVMPRLESLWNMNDLGDDGYTVTHSSRGYILDNCGVKNAGRHGCQCRTSVLAAYNTIWTGTAHSAIRVEQGAVGSFNGADASNSNHTDDPSSSGFGRAIYASRASILNFAGGTCNDSGWNGIVARRSWVNAFGATVLRSGNAGLQADQGGHIMFSGAGAEVTGSSNVDARVLSGGNITLAGATYGTLGQQVNLQTGEGIITDNSVDSTFESGSNSNGTYTRYPDGSLMCRHHIKAVYEGPGALKVTWTFPYAFTGPDEVSISAMLSQRDGNNTIDKVNFDKSLDGNPVIEAFQGTGVAIRVENSSDPFVSGDYVWLSVMAIGRWK